MFFRKKRSIQRNDKVQVYIDEYKLVTNKITSLSLKFSNGSYIFPISIIAGLASITVDYLYINITLIIIPVILTFYIYNHIRYMALQFKLSGYAKHLELKINEILGEKVLLWENTIARDNGQNFYEGIFLGAAYIAIILFMYYLSYNRLSSMIFEYKISYGIVCVITGIYYFSATSLIFFLMFFTNEHSVSFIRAQNAVAKNTLKTEYKIFNILKKIVVRLIIVITIFMMFPTSLLPLVYFSKNNTYHINNEYSYIVVLGNKSENNIPSNDMKSRLDCLISKVSEYSEAIIVLSGGNGEALLMKDYLIKNGIEEYKIITEEKSQNTYENFVNSSSIVSNHVLIITSDYHIFRANLFNSKMGLHYDFCAARTDTLVFFKAIKECYAIYLDMLRFI